MSDRGSAWWRFFVRALFFAVVVAFTRYFVGLILGSHTSAEYFESFATRWFVMVPLFLALGAVWALLDGWVARWAKKREARRTGRHGSREAD